MANETIRSPEQAEDFLSTVFEILDSYDYDRFDQVFSANLKYAGGLESSLGLAKFIADVKASTAKIPGMKTSHSRFENDITSDGTIYSSGHSTATFPSHPDKPVTVPMIGVFKLEKEGPEKGRIAEMRVYKDRLPFFAMHQQLPGMKAN